MIGGFDADIALGRKIDADRAEDFGAERLRAMRDQRDLDAPNTNAGAVAELHLGAAETLLPVFHQPDDGCVRVDRQARAWRGLAAEAQRDRLADAGRMTERDRHR